MIYKPISISEVEIHGLAQAIRAMRYPMKQFLSKTRSFSGDIELARRLVKAGDSHAKCMRGVQVWFTIEMQIGFMLEFDTYRIGIDCLSSSSTMHTTLKGLSGQELAEHKQRDLPNVVYRRGFIANYQALRNIYHQRKHHRHPDWQLFCNWIAGLPNAETLITVGE